MIKYIFLKSTFDAIMYFHSFIQLQELYHSHHISFIYKLQQRDVAKLEASLESDIFRTTYQKPTLIVLVFHISHKWITQSSRERRGR